MRVELPMYRHRPEKWVNQFRFKYGLGNVRIGSSLDESGSGHIQVKFKLGQLWAKLVQASLGSKSYQS